MRALVLAPFSQQALAALAELMPVEYESWTDTQRLYDPEELGERIRKNGVTHLIVEADFVFEETLKSGGALQFVGVCRASLDHVDLDAATRFGVLVVNTPGRNARAVAELALGLMIALSRRVAFLDNYVKEGRWENPLEAYMNLRGVELGGRTLGVIGLGAVGRTLAGMANAIGMRTVAFDPYASDVPHYVEAHTLEAALATSDFLSLHAPRTAETTAMLGRAELELLPRGSYLINTAFYEMVEEEALLEALQSGRLAGAALDVHETHPILPNSPLLKAPNVILTPHIGGATDETIERHSAMALDDIRRHIAGERPRRLANPDAWPPIDR